tara:strand:+ start:584 stop:751 length:168 start_codon:yes stop_codon:yes gene_type:complete
MTYEVMNTRTNRINGLWDYATKKQAQCAANNLNKSHNRIQFIVVTMQNGLIKGVK